METPQDQDDKTNIESKITTIVDSIVGKMKDEKLSRFESFLVLDAARVLIMNDYVKDMIANSFVKALMELDEKTKQPEDKTGGIYK